jgi:hypothetical protein
MLAEPQPTRGTNAVLTSIVLQRVPRQEQTSARHSQKVKNTNLEILLEIGLVNLLRNLVFPKRENRKDDRALFD